jgi:hypothetical protein
MLMAKADMVELLGELPQIFQHCQCQFTPSVGNHVYLDDCIEQLVDLLQHCCTHILALFDGLVKISQFLQSLNDPKLPAP